MCAQRLQAAARPRCDAVGGARRHHGGGDRLIANLAPWFGWRLLAAQAWPALAIATAVTLGRGRWPLAELVRAAGAVGAKAQRLIPLVA